VLVRTEPDTFATVTDLDAPVRFHFDERISESVTGGELDDAVSVSPLTGEVRVSHGRTTLTVEVEGGFRPGLLYRVTLQPMVRDLFGNQLRDPFELVFSTGGTAPPTAVAGQAWNRTTGAPLSGALVQAVSSDSLTHVARTDQEGIYVLRYLPDGPYRITAFEDVDRDRVLDARETQGSVDALVSAGDTLLVDVGVLPIDTTSAELVAATVLDSVTVVLEFDDYLDNESSSETIAVEVIPPTGPGLAVSRVYHEREYNELVEAVADSLARLDSLDAAARAAALPPDTVTAGGGPPADTVAVDSVPRRAPPPALDGRMPSRGQALPGGPQGPQRPLPGRRIVALLGSPLAVEVEHTVRASGAVNINGVGGGGGETTLVRQLPPPPAEAPAADTTAPAPNQPPGVNGS
jgi:hypothetical protein